MTERTLTYTAPIFAYGKEGEDRNRYFDALDQALRDIAARDGATPVPISIRIEKDYTTGQEYLRLDAIKRWG